MQSPRAAGRVPGPGNEMLAVGDTSSSATSAPGGKKLYQEEDIGKLAVLGREHPADSGVATKFAMCVAAASVAEFATYPLDLTKTRCADSAVLLCIMHSAIMHVFSLQAADPGRGAESRRPGPGQVQGDDPDRPRHRPGGGEQRAALRPAVRSLHDCLHSNA